VESHLLAADVPDQYFDPRLAASLDSMEGVPDWPEVAETPFERSRKARLQHQAHQIFEWLGTLAPGVALAVLIAVCGNRLSIWLGTDLLGFAKSPISEITLATLLGLAIRNLIGLPAVYESGLRVCLRWILRGGIVLLGLRLSLGELGAIGLTSLPVIVVCIASALFLVSLINRALGLPRRLGSLIAVGTSICGVSAVVATGPVIEAEEEEVSYAVACVTLFGMIALFTYPFLAYFLFGPELQQAGIFLGTAIHDTAQVAGAGLMYKQYFSAPEALDAAMVTKLLRNLCMAAVIPLVGILYHRGAAGSRDGKKVQRKWHDIVPLFVIGFMLMAVLRTAGDWGEPRLPTAAADAWHQLLKAAETVSGWCLTVAMTAVGLGTGLAKLRKVGLKPFAVGLSAAVLVGAVSFLLIKVIGLVT
jgi:uncharacterized integral membrane protein (TIGR00698 family)